MCDHTFGLDSTVCPQCIERGTAAVVRQARIDAARAAVYSEEFDEKKPLDTRVLRYVKRNPGKTVLEISNALELHFDDVRIFLRNQVEAGVLHSEPGQGPNGGHGYYEGPGWPKKERVLRAKTPTLWQRLLKDDS